VILGVLTAPLLALASSVLYFQLRGSAAPEPAGTAPVDAPPDIGL
jgi:hypothetical protein